jgi:hypothetical protein
MISRNAVRFYNNVGVTATYAIRRSLVQEFPFESLVFAAVRMVIAHHPAMGVTILEDDLKPSFVRLKTIDLQDVVGLETLDSGMAPENFIESAHQRPFENLGELPLWRIIVLEHASSTTIDASFDICFFAHHAIFDGQSCISFHLSFLEAMNKVVDDISQTNLDPIIIPPKLDLLPPIEEAHPLPVSFCFLLRQLFKLIFRRKPDKLHWTGPPIFSKPIITCLRTLYLPSSIANSLVNLCRKNRVSFTSLLLVVISGILADNYPDHERFTSKTAMSFRRFTPKVDKRDMVCYVSAMRHFFSRNRRRGYIPCGGQFSWDAARSSKRIIDAATSDPKNNGVALLRYLDDYTSWLKRQVGGKRPDSFAVSNVGVVDAEDGGRGIKMTRLLFSQSSNVIGPPYAFSVATLNGGDLAIALDWQEGVVDVRIAEKVLSGLELVLKNLANQG